MCAVILDGKATALALEEELAIKIKSLQNSPKLSVILVGDHPPSEIYVSRKTEACARVGIESQIIRLSETISREELEREIEALNTDKNIHGILIQLPLPEGLKKDQLAIMNKVNPLKDVDGLTQFNAGALVTEQPGLKPCTPLGIMRLLKHYNISLSGKHAVIIGRSNLFGRPMANMLLNANCTITQLHMLSENPKQLCRLGDIVIAAAGHPDLIQNDWVKDGAIVIDGGITRTENNRITGDVDFESVKDTVGYITKVPGGVGPMTISSLLHNTIEAFNLQNR